jgi:hypothetical protein
MSFWAPYHGKNVEIDQTPALSEGLNPDSSAKEIPALNILKSAMTEGRIGPSTVNRPGFVGDSKS